MMNEQDWIELYGAYGKRVFDLQQKLQRLGYSFTFDNKRDHYYEYKGERTQVGESDRQWVVFAAFEDFESSVTSKALAYVIAHKSFEDAEQFSNLKITVEQLLKDTE